LAPAVQAQDGLLTPLSRLLDALWALDNNNVLPLLRPTPGKGPPPADNCYNSMKGSAVFTVMRLIALGTTAPEARKAVANTLRKVGVKRLRTGANGGTRELTERTIRGWQEEVSADVGVRKWAARQCIGLEMEYFQEDVLGFTPTTAQR